MTTCSRFLRFGLTALLTCAWNSSFVSDYAQAAPRKAKHQVKAKQKKNKKKKLTLVKNLTPLEAAPSEALPPAAPAPLSGPSCPAAGNIGIHHADEWTAVISSNLARTIEICEDLVFSTLPDPISSGLSGLAPGDWMYGFQGVLEGNGHTVRIMPAADPQLSRGISLRFETLNNATVQNLTIDGQGSSVTETLPGYVIAAYATNSILRNIQLRNIETASGIVYNGRSLRVESMNGDIRLKPYPTQRVAGGLAQTCENCSVSNSNLNIVMDPAEGSTGPTYPTYSGGLVGYVHAGSLTVTNTMLSGAIRRGYDRGMIVGAMDGSPSSIPASDGSFPPAELTIDGVRATNVDMTEHPDVRSYTVGALVGRASLPTLITRTLVRNARIVGDQQAGGLIGGASQVTASEVAVHGVSVQSNGVAGGLIGWNSGRMDIEDSYFNGHVEQSGELIYGATPLFAAGGMIGFANNEDSLRRVYVNARVTANESQNAGAVVGADSGALGFGTITGESVYYNRALASQLSAIGVGLSAEEMLAPASFAGFGESEWSLRTGHLPLLRNRPLFQVQDLFDFLSLYFAQSARADINDDGSISVEDLFEFLEMYHGQ